MQHFFLAVADNTTPRDLSSRADYFSRAITESELCDSIGVEFKDNTLRLKTFGVGQFEVNGADLQGRNPYLFRYGSFKDFQDAWTRMDRILATAIRATPIDSLTLHLTVNPEVYETLTGELNDFGAGWEVQFYGSYAPGIDPYTAGQDRSSDGRFPVVVWMPQDGPVNFEIDVIPTLTGRFLEIHSNCGDMQRLLDEAESATGQKFTPIASNA